MEEIIIIETSKPQKLKNFLDREHYLYKTYQKSKSNQKIDIFASYSEISKDNKWEKKALQEWEKLTDNELITEWEQLLNNDNWD